MKYHFNRQIVALFLGGILCGCVLCGCGSKAREEELSYREIGITAMESGNYEEAVAAFDAALGKCGGSVGKAELDICYYKAAAQYAAEDFEGARATCEALVEYNPKDANAWYLYGCLLLSLEQPDEAKKAYESAVADNSADYERYIAIYENLCAYNLKEDGEEFLNKAFSLKGDTAADNAARGRIYYLLGQYENAKTELDAAIEKKEPEANLTMAEVCEALGDTAGAENYYAAYVEQGAKDAGAMNALAELAMAKGDYSAALSYTEQGLAREEDECTRELMQNRIIAMEMTGDFAGAFGVISEYVTLYPEDENAAREYIFLKNRQGIKEPVPDTEAAGDVPDTEAAGSSEAGEGAAGTP